MITTKITRIVEEPQVEAEVTGSVVAALFGLDGFRVLAAADDDGSPECSTKILSKCEGEIGPFGLCRVGR